MKNNMKKYFNKYTGRMLFNYNYDPEFTKYIKNLKPSWFKDYDPEFTKYIKNLKPSWF